MPNPYDLIAEQWHSSLREQTYVARVPRYVVITVWGLPPGARILDLGFGTGTPVAEHRIRHGFGVVGVDSSEKMLEIARRVVPEAKLVRGDMLDTKFDAPFSAAVAWDSIFHVERVHHQAIFRKLYGSLGPGGGLLLSGGGSENRGFTSEMYGHSFFYSGYSPAVTLDLLREKGFRIDLCEVDDPSSQGHVAIIARKPA